MSSFQVYKMTSYSSIQNASFWDAHGPLPSGNLSLQDCSNQCKMYSGTVGFNSNATALTSGSCYCLLGTDLGFYATGSEYTSYLFGGSSGSAVEATKDNTYKYAFYVTVSILALFAIKALINAHQASFTRTQTL